MATYLTYAAGVYPADGSWANPFSIYYPERAIAHAAMPIVPRYQENADAPGWLDGSFNAPPPSVVACVTTSVWTLSASISAGGMTLTVSGIDFEHGTTTDGEWRKYFQIPTTVGDTLVEYGPDPEGDDIQLHVSLGSTETWFAWGEEKWFPSMSFFLSANKSGSGGGSGQHELQRGTPLSYTTGPVTVSVAGDDFVLYEVGTPTLAITGSITLTPKTPLVQV
jgi:hypothetical protein